MNIIPFSFVIFFLSCTTAKHSTQSVPACINTKIEEFKKEPKQNPPRSITEFTYKGNKVYYIPAPCCDQLSAVIDKDCNLLGYPDGGFTGKGDGSLPNFAKEATNEKLIWKDER
jgi:hypothetical protein